MIGSMRHVQIRFERERVRATWQQGFSEALKGDGQVPQKEYAIRCKDGSTKTFLAGATVQGNRSVVSFVDVDERKRMEEQVEASRKRFAALFEVAPFSVTISRFDGRLLMANQHFCETVGKTHEEVLDRTFEQLGINLDAEAADEMLVLLQRDGHCPLREVVAQGPKSLRTLLLASRVVEWDEGKAVLSTTVDITDRREAQERIRSSEERFTKVFELTPDLIVISALADGKTVAVNEGFEKTTGWSRDEVVGRSAVEIGFWSDPSMRREMVEALETVGEILQREISFRRKDGTQRDGVYSARAIELGSERHLIFVMQDVTEERAAREALRREKENLAVTLDSIGDAVIATDTEGRITRMNPVASQLTGWSSEQAQGKRLREVFNIVHPDSRKPAVSPVARVLDSGSTVSLASHSLLISRDGKEHQIADSGAPILLDDGTVIGVVLVFRDMTQENQLQEQLRQSQKMEAVGQLAGGVAHDFNNMLAAIVGCADLLTESIEEGTEDRELVDDILSASQRAADLTQKLLVFSRKQETEMAPLRVDLPIRDALGLLERTIDRRIRLDISLDEQPLRVRGDRSLLQNAVLNLLINATHAMPEGGELRVATRRVELDDAACKMTGFAVQPGPHVEIEVRDSGVGIPHDDLSRIFEPFFTTKEQGKGTGLGLAAVFGAVKQHDGAITVYSEVGVGTCFRILLPVVGERASMSVPEEELVGGAGRILLVDDEQILRNVAARMLERLGYEVTTASNGAEAIKVFEAQGGDFDLVILDMSMPEMNGKDCFYALRNRRPDVRIMLASGFTREEDVDALVGDGLVGFIQKPFRSTVLGKAIRAALEGPLPPRIRGASIMPGRR